MNILLERLRRLPLDPALEIEGTWGQSPIATQDTQHNNGIPYLPMIPFWADRTRRTPLNIPDLFEPAKATYDAALGIFVNACEQAKARPTKVFVRGKELADFLREKIAELGIPVEHADHLPVIDPALQLIREAARENFDAHIPLVAGKLTPAVYASFTQAARLFWDAAPWRHLDNLDLLRILSPKPPRGMALASVMGAGGEQFGIQFFLNDKQSQRFMAGDLETFFANQRSPSWSFNFSRLEDADFAFTEAWQDAGNGSFYTDPNNHPRVPAFDGTLAFETQLPSHTQMIFTDGLLRALAATTEAQLDAGRWEITVQRHGGKATYAFEMPGVLNPPEDSRLDDPRLAMEAFHRMAAEFLAQGDFSSLEEANAQLQEKMLGKRLDDLVVEESNSNDPKKKALGLAAKAEDHEGRHSLKLLREALALDPDCVDALNGMGQRNLGSPQEAHDWYAKAEEAGRRELGERFFTENTGHFWGMHQTRPYMRALWGKAMTWVEMKKHEQAIETYQRMLVLCPNDNMGARDPLATELLLLGRWRDVADLVKTYPGHEPTLTLAAACAAWGQKNKAEGERQLRQLNQLNPHLLRIIASGKEPERNFGGSYALGSEEEAVYALQELAPALVEHDGMLDWLVHYAHSHTHGSPIKHFKVRKKR